MGKERKPIVVLVDQNPSMINLSREVRNLDHVELIYFKLMRMDLSGGVVPINFYLRISDTQSVRSDQIIPSNNPATVTVGGISYGRLRMDTVPLHYWPAPVYDVGGVPVNIPFLAGTQPPGMRWQADNVSAMSNFQVTLLDFAGNPFNFSNTGTTMELVFDAVFEPPVNQTQDWRTNQVYMNSMNA